MAMEQHKPNGAAHRSFEENEPRQQHQPATCLLAEYVRKELTVAHVSDDGESLLLTCDMTGDADSEQLSFLEWTKFFSAASKSCNAEHPLRMVTQSENLGLLEWASNLSATQSIWKGEEDGTIMKIAKKCWHESLGFEDAMVDMVSQHMPHSFMVDKDGAGRPCFSMAVSVKHGEFTTPWNKFARSVPSGVMEPFGASGTHCSAILLPSQEHQQDYGLISFFCSPKADESDAAKTRNVLEGACTWSFTGKQLVENMGHFRVPGKSSLMPRLCYFMAAGDKDPELGRWMRTTKGNNRRGDTYFMMPFGLDDLIRS